MQIKFKLVPGTAIDGIVKSLQESTTDPIIDIHIERGEVEVKSRPSFYLSPDVAIREFQEGTEESAAADAKISMKDWTCGSPTCPVCHPAPLATLSRAELDMYLSQSGSRQPKFSDPKITGPESIAEWVRSCFKPKRKAVAVMFGGFLGLLDDPSFPREGCECDVCNAVRNYRGFGL